MKSNRDLALHLTKKAEHDLRMADIGLAHAAPLDTIAFHVQQTAEKTLKALLASRDIEYPRTHDVEALLDLAVPLYPELEAHREPLLGLSAYAVDMRYDADLDPSREEVEAALQAVRRLRETVARLLATT
jgi:HEPN domain-containing protein